jgi:hypothetical protein
MFVAYRQAVQRQGAMYYCKFSGLKHFMHCCVLTVGHRYSENQEMCLHFSSISLVHFFYRTPPFSCSLLIFNKRNPYTCVVPPFLTLRSHERLTLLRVSAV